MTITLLTFGKIKEICNFSQKQMQNISDTEILVQNLKSEYPEMGNIPFKISINNEIISKFTELNDGDIVALLPPFSGG
jgi:molybdopterin converting factor small subunit